MSSTLVVNLQQDYDLTCRLFTCLHRCCLTLRVPPAVSPPFNLNVPYFLHLRTQHNLAVLTFPVSTTDFVNSFHNLNWCPSLFQISPILYIYFPLYCLWVVINSLTKMPTFFYHFYYFLKSMLGLFLNIIFPQSAAVRAMYSTHVVWSRFHIKSLLVGF